MRRWTCRQSLTKIGSLFLLSGAAYALLSIGAATPAGAQNTSFGLGALLSITSGTADTALGLDALSQDTTGSNRAVGVGASAALLFWLGQRGCLRGSANL